MLNKHKTTTSVKTFRPLPNGWPIKFFDIQHSQHWKAEEVDLGGDYDDFYNTLDDNERNILKRALLLFTQLDTEVARCYYDYYIPFFKAHDVRMMLGAFAAMEGIHMRAYDRLNSGLKLPESFYGEFLNIKEMYDKFDYMQHFDTSSPQSIALNLAIISGFCEGLVLFSSFAIIIYFSLQRNKVPGKNNCMVGVGQIITLSMRDEALHVHGVSRLFHEYVKENADTIDIDQLNKDITTECIAVVEREIYAIKNIYGSKGLEALPEKDLIDFIKYFADIRLKQLGLSTIYNIKINPLQWMEDVLHLQETVNFFESTPTGYSKANEKVAWDEDIFES